MSTERQSDLIYNLGTDHCSTSSSDFFMERYGQAEKEVCV